MAQATGCFDGKYFYLMLGFQVTEARAGSWPKRFPGEIDRRTAEENDGLLKTQWWMIPKHQVTDYRRPMTGAAHGPSTNIHRVVMNRQTPVIVPRRIPELRKGQSRSPRTDARPPFKTRSSGALCRHGFAVTEVTLVSFPCALPERNLSQLLGSPRRARLVSQFRHDSIP